MPTVYTMTQAKVKALIDDTFNKGGHGYAKTQTRARSCNRQNHIEPGQDWEDVLRFQVS